MSKAKEYLKRVGLLQSPYISQERVIKHLEAFANEQIEAITVTRCCKSDSELFTPNDIKLPKENKPISMHTDSKKPLTKKV